jgi:U3 small nucleolar RNA-associated protein 14
MQAPRKKNEVLLSKDSAPLTKSKNKLKKQAKKREEEKEKMKDDAAVEISMDNVLSLGGEAFMPPTLTPESATKQKATENRKVPMTNGGTTDDDDDANSEVEAQEKVLDLKGMAKTKGPKAFEQRDLVALAFAGDNVVQVGHYVPRMQPLFTLSFQEFEEAKRREIAADAPREVDTTIPGWVCWISLRLRFLLTLVSILGVMGRNRDIKSTTKTAANQKDRRYQSHNPSRLRQGTHHHF